MAKRSKRDVRKSRGRGLAAAAGSAESPRPLRGDASLGQRSTWCEAEERGGEEMRHEEVCIGVSDLHEHRYELVESRRLLLILVVLQACAESLLEVP